MSWFRKEAALQTDAFLSYCSKAFSKSNKETFKHCLNPPQHYLCVVHVMKVARQKGAKIVSLPEKNLSSGFWRKIVWLASNPSSATEMHKDFINIIYALIAFDTYTSSINKWKVREFC